MLATTYPNAINDKPVNTRHPDKSVLGLSTGNCNSRTTTRRRRILIITVTIMITIIITIIIIIIIYFRFYILCFPYGFQCSKALYKRENC